MSGRAYIYGLGAGGEAGVARAIEIIRNELDISMALTGVTSIAAIDRRVITAV
jgi:L-lactate dehydrogenase (cytochrome)